MFGMKKKALMERVRELELALAQEKQKSEKESAELEAYRERSVLRERTFEELKMAMERKIQDLDERILNFEHSKEEENHKLQMQKAELQKNLQEEVETTRQTLRREISDAKDATRHTLTASIQAFDNTYNYYLMQIQRQMERLSNAAMKVGSNFFEADAQELSRIFHSEMHALASGETMHESVIPTEADEALQMDVSEPVAEPAAEPLPVAEPAAQIYGWQENSEEDVNTDHDERIRQLINILNDESLS